MQAYFDFLYNPVYDITTARLNRYRESQRRCIGEFEFNDGDTILCVGIGTGNEVLHILQANRNVKIVGIDYSKTAVQKAYKKALALGKKIEVFRMDARCLKFPAESFDKVLCFHVIDFVEDGREVTREILRVLKGGGQFLITYPSDKEGPKLGYKLLKDSIYHSGKKPTKTILDLALQMVVGIVYIPLLLRPRRQSYSHDDLEGMLTELAGNNFQIEEDAVYQDFIICGRKLTGGGG